MEIAKMKKMRPLTKTEKVLLTVLVVLLVYFVFYKYVFLVQTDKISVLETESRDYDSKINENNRILKNENKIIEDRLRLSEEKDKIVANYFPIIDQSQIIYLLNDLLTDSDVDISNFSFSRPSLINMMDTEVAVMDINIPFEGEYTAIERVLQAVEKSPRRILFNHLSFNKSENEDLLSGNMIMNILSLEGMVDTDGQVIYVETVDRLKDNPFKEYDSYTGSKNNEGGSNQIDVSPPNNIERPPIDSGSKTELMADFTSFNFKDRKYRFIETFNLDGDVSFTQDKDNHIITLKYFKDDYDRGKGYIYLSPDKVTIDEAGDYIGLKILASRGNLEEFSLLFKDKYENPFVLDLILDKEAGVWNDAIAYLPQDKDLYPISLEGIGLVVPDTNYLKGQVSFNKLDMYSNYLLYKVLPGDTIYDLSVKFYGTSKYMNEILEINNMKKNDILPIGRILRIKKHKELIK